MQKVNPFLEKTKPIEKSYESLKKLAPMPYDPESTSPFTKERAILMNGTEDESVWFLHQFARNCNNDEIKRYLAVVRNQEQQQQKRISALKPINENILETTIAFAWMCCCARTK